MRLKLFEVNHIPVSVTCSRMAASVGTECNKKKEKKKQFWRVCLMNYMWGTGIVTCSEIQLLSCDGWKNGLMGKYLGSNIYFNSSAPTLYCVQDLCQAFLHSNRGRQNKQTNTQKKTVGCFVWCFCVQNVILLMKFRMTFIWPLHRKMPPNWINVSMVCWSPRLFIRSVRCREKQQQKRPFLEFCSVD